MGHDHHHGDECACTNELNQCGCSCGCGGGDEEELHLWQIIVGAGIFLVTLFSGLVPPTYELPAYIVAYLLLGHGIIRSALSNIIHGRMFDETLLMVIATLGAFAIGDYAEAAGVMLFNRIGETLEEQASERSRSQIMAAVDMRPQTVRRLSPDGTWENVPAASAAIGDTIQVRVGDRIPLDGIVRDGESLIDTSAITGEPVPVRYQPGDTVLSGGVNTTAVLTLCVTKELSESMVSKILQSVEEAAARKPHMDRFITRFARIYTPAVVAVAVATAVIPSMVTGQWNHWIYVALTFLVISCPCALVLSVPLSFFAGIGAASKAGILFKGGAAMEALSRVKAVVLDKTGTVTEGNFVVQSIQPVPAVTAEMLLQLCASVERDSTHPIARSIVKAAEERQLHALAATDVREQAGSGISAMIAGKMVLCGNRGLLERSGIAVPVAAGQAYGSELFVAAAGQYLGSLVISDTIKSDAVSAVQALHDQGAATAMLTGDSAAAAEYIAGQTGIDEVRAKLLPTDKVKEMDGLRQKYGPVLFVGDGINDAPVLAGADVGAAMGSGADAAVEAADVVVLKSRMAAIPQALRLSRSTLRIAWQNIILALVVKGAVMAAGFAGYASLWAAVFADTGVAMLCVMNSVRMLYKR